MSNKKNKAQARHNKAIVKARQAKPPVKNLKRLEQTAIRTQARTTKTFKDHVTTFEGDRMTRERVFKGRHRENPNRLLNDYVKPKFGCTIHQKRYKPYDLK